MLNVRRHLFNTFSICLFIFSSWRWRHCEIIAIFSCLSVMKINEIKQQWTAHNQRIHWPAACTTQSMHTRRKRTFCTHVVGPKLICIDKQRISTHPAVDNTVIKRLYITLIWINCAIKLCSWTFTFRKVVLQQISQELAFYRTHSSFFRVVLLCWRSKDIITAWFMGREGEHIPFSSRIIRSNCYR